MWFLIFFLLICTFCLIILYIDLFFKFRDLENTNKTNEEYLQQKIHILDQYYTNEIHILKCNQTAIFDNIVKLDRK